MRCTPRSIKFITLTFALLLTACGGDNEGSGSLIGLPKSGNGGGSGSPVTPDNPEPPSADGSTRGFLLKVQAFRTNEFSALPEVNGYFDGGQAFMTSDRRLFIKFGASSLTEIQDYLTIGGDLNQPIQTLWTDDPENITTTFAIRDGSVKIQSLRAQVNITTPTYFKRTSENSSVKSPDEVNTSIGEVVFQYTPDHLAYTGTVSFDNTTFHIVLRDPSPTLFNASYEIPGESLFETFIAEDRVIDHISKSDTSGIHVDNLGNIAADSSIWGCSIGGQFKILNPDFNELEMVNVTLQEDYSCATPGDYRGVLYFYTTDSLDAAPTPPSDVLMNIFLYNNNTVITTTARSFDDNL